MPPVRCALWTIRPNFNMGIGRRTTSLIGLSDGEQTSSEGTIGTTRHDELSRPQQVDAVSGVQQLL